MRGKQLEKRRHAMVELARLDASRRCAFCKRALPVGFLTVFGSDRRYCNDDCCESAEEAALLRQRMRMPESSR